MAVNLRNYRSATNAEITEIERKLGTKFPIDYREFLSKTDAAIPESNVFKNDVHVSVERFTPLSEILRNYEITAGLPADALPIADGPSSDVFF